MEKLKQYKYVHNYDRSYGTRLREFNDEKRKLENMYLTEKQYENRVKELAKRFHI